MFVASSNRRRRFAIASASALMLPVAVSACRSIDEPDLAAEMASATCEPVFADCPCASPRFSESECIAKVTAGWRERQASAEKRGLVYDAGCAARTASRIEQAACPQTPASHTSFCEDDAPCAIYRGARAAGESCEIGDDGFSTCDEGLICDLSLVCAPLCTPLAQEGEPCTDTPCATGLFCGGSSTCERVAEEGESCAGAVCSDDTHCDANHVCAKPTDDGGPCNQDEECASGTCSNGTCLRAEATLCSANL